ncbi:ABC transporter permease subunit [Frigoribacterium sp. VKM Ac-2530]|uniref:ABC transporter permease subunit n=1 Tax=Frigoribacterium sp. VKM Ac-2530 TaxID=2783822 RepID=UPI00188CDC51|nr:ABC transporter permease subunit [Frigoribacterium sp. VKM Ac-2530]MBF4579148.1 ABC transporter permease subunit [Frigoribacterium sp. VKM Ac-2530]
MTTTTTPRPTPHAHTAGSGVSFAHVLRSEWIKLRSLRSTAWCFAVIVVLLIGFALLFGAFASGFEGAPATDEQQQSLAVSVATIGVPFAQLVAAVLGALVITGEYGTGMVRSTFAAVPRRTPALVAKVLLIGVTTFVVSALALAVALLVSTPLLSSSGVDTDLADGRIWLSMLGGAATIGFIAMIAFGLGAIIRNGAGAIASAIGIVFVLPIIFSIGQALIAKPWIYSLYEFIPPQAATRVYDYPVDGQSLTALPGLDGSLVLEPWQALLVLVGWVVVLFAIALALVKRRDV